MTQIPNVGPVIHAAGRNGNGGSQAGDGEEAGAFEGILAGMIASQITREAAPVEVGAGAEETQVADSETAVAAETTPSETEGPSSLDGGTGAETGASNPTEGGESMSAGEIDTGEETQAGAGENAAGSQEAEVLASVLAAAAQADSQQLPNAEDGLEGVVADGAAEKTMPVAQTVTVDAEAPAGDPLQAEAGMSVPAGTPETEEFQASQAPRPEPVQAVISAEGTQTAEADVAQFTGGEALIEGAEAEGQLEAQAPEGGEAEALKAEEGAGTVLPREQFQAAELGSRIAELGGEVVSRPSESQATPVEGAQDVPAAGTTTVKAGTEEVQARPEVEAHPTNANVETALETPDRGEMPEAQPTAEVQVEASAQVSEEEVERSAQPEVARTNPEVKVETGSKQTGNPPVETSEAPKVWAPAKEAATEVPSTGTEATRAPEGDAVPQGPEVVEGAATQKTGERSESAVQSEPNAGAVKVEAGEAMALDRPAEAQTREAVAAEKAGQTPARTPELEPQRGQIMDQVVRSAKFNLDAGNSRFELRLEPPELGRMGVVVDLKEGALTVSFRVENEAVRELLQGSMAQLRAALSDQGVVVEGLDVQSSGPQAGEQQAAGNDSGSDSTQRGGSGPDMEMSEEPVVSEAGMTPGSGAVDYWA